MDIHIGFDRTDPIHKIKFSDSQIIYKLDEKYLHTLNNDAYHRIFCRLTSWDVLQELVVMKKTIDSAVSKTECHLYISYMLGARSDRSFESKTAHYIRDVISPIINSLEFDEVRVLDPHSNDTITAIRSSKPDDISYSQFCRWAHNHFGDMNYAVVVPDLGARKRAELYCKNVGKDDGLIQLDKHRKISTGEILGMRLVDFGGLHIPAIDAFVVVDDICDGGRTFIETAKLLKQYYNDKDRKFHLVVTHGIFSKGFEPLFRWYNSIITTNSFADHIHEDINLFRLYA